MCEWRSASQLVAYLTRDTAARPGMHVEVLPGLVCITLTLTLTLTRTRTLTLTLTRTRTRTRTRTLTHHKGDNCSSAASCDLAGRLPRLVSTVAALDLAPMLELSWLVRTMEALPHWPSYP